jgi:hypothetical protein
MPVVELIPTGVASPWACVAASRSPERGPALDPGAPRAGVDLHGLHARQVDHEPVVAQRVAGDVVPAAAYGQEHAVLAREVQRLDHVLRPRAGGDDRRTLVDHAVPDLAGLVVARVARNEDLASETLLQSIDLGGIHSRHVWLHRSGRKDVFRGGSARSDTASQPPGVAPSGAQV